MDRYLKLCAFVLFSRDSFHNFRSIVLILKSTYYLFVFLSSQHSSRWPKQKWRRRGMESNLLKHRSKSV